MAQRSERRAHPPQADKRLAVPSPWEGDWPAARHDILVRLALQRLVARLPQRLAGIVQAYYGLDGAEPASFRHIGVVVGLNRETIRVLHVQALIWLRHPAHSQELRALLGRHAQGEYESADEKAQLWRRRRGNRRDRAL